MKIPDRLAMRLHVGLTPHMRGAQFVRFMCVIAAVGAMSACDKGPVQWQSDTRQLTVPVSGDESSAADARLVLRTDGSPALEASGAAPTVPADSAACPGSLRVAVLSSSEIYSVWWSRRDAGRAVLLSARSDNAGATWMPIVPVDTTDRGPLSCARPAPSIAADSASGYVHVTYFLNSPTGPGVFFSHSMERGELFHSPVPIMYGERPSASAVTSADSVVLVAFENPSAQRAQIAIAMSKTWGHIFAPQRPEVSTGTMTAEKPLVALRQSQVVVGWRGQDRAITARVGTLK